MFPSNNFKKMSTSPAPPQEPSLYPTTTTGIPVKIISQNNPTRASATTDLPSHSPVTWSTGLCDCYDDVSSCCITIWCPCVTFGRIAEIVDRGSTSCGVSGALYMVIMCMTGCPCLYSCFYRSKLRGQYFLEENPFTDCCLHCCCEGCALCQEYRELKNRGFDMSIGWHGNMERRKREVAVPPAGQEGMNR